MKLRTVLAGALLALVPSLALGQVMPDLPAPNTVYAGPASGSAVGPPSFRALTAPDMPTPTSVKTADYTVAATDCGSLIQAGTGTTGGFIVTLPSPSSFRTGCIVSVLNGDTGRAKLLSGFPDGFDGAPLWPLQTITVQNINGAWSVISAPGRWAIIADTTLFIDPVNGNDDNDCLTSGTGACKTFDAAWIIASTAIDYDSHNVTLQFASSGYTSFIDMEGTGTTGGGFTILDFGGGTLDVSGGRDIFIAIVPPANVLLQNGTIKSTVGGSNAEMVEVDNGTLYIGDGLTFGVCTDCDSQLFVESSLGELVIASASGFGGGDPISYTISGGAGCHAQAFNGGQIYLDGATITVTGTPAFSEGFACGTGLGVMSAVGVTFSGSATGPHFLAELNGMVETETGDPGTSNSCDPDYFPGSTDGILATGGLCW